MNGFRPGHYPTQIAEQDEDRITDEFTGIAQADYTGHQTDSKPFLTSESTDEITSIQEDETTSDDQIRENINEVLSKDKDIDQSQLKIRVQQGIVTLSGTVQNRDERFKVEMAIETINGVEDIVNQLQLRKAQS